MGMIIRVRPSSVLVCSVFLFTVLAQEPEFSEKIPNITVPVGRDAVFPCVVEHLGSYKVAWFHIDRQMILTIHHHVITRDHRISVSHSNHRNWLLHIRNVQTDDTGFYMCQINTTPMKSQVGYLTVVVPPDILDNESSPSTVKVREIHNVSLTCKAAGSPEPRISWKREDNRPFALGRQEVREWPGSSLNISKVSRLHMGAYLCIAVNDVLPSVSKRIMLEVEFSPMIWIPNQLVGAPMGTDVLLECHTEAFPKSINYWARDTGMIMSNNKYETMEYDSMYKVHMKLRIRRLQTSDFGQYKCVAKNNLGETEGSIGLYDIQPPTRTAQYTEVPAYAIPPPTEDLTDHNSRNASAAGKNQRGSRLHNLVKDRALADTDPDDPDAADFDSPQHIPQRNTGESRAGSLLSMCISWTFWFVIPSYLLLPVSWCCL